MQDISTTQAQGEDATREQVQREVGAPKEVEEEASRAGKVISMTKRIDILQFEE